MYDFVENEVSQKRCLIGIGDTGNGIVQKYIKNNNNDMCLMADISHRNLNEVVSEQKLYLMGDVELREMLTVENRQLLTQFVRADTKVYIITRLDNELNLCLVVEKIVRHLYHINREVVLITIKPFMFELPPWRLDRVKDTLKSFEKYVRKLIVFDSEELLGIKEVSLLPMKECFDFMDKAIVSFIEKRLIETDEVFINVNLKDMFEKQ